MNKNIDLQTALVSVPCDDRQPTAIWRYTDIHVNSGWIKEVVKDWTYRVGQSVQPGKVPGTGCQTCIYNFFIDFNNKGQSNSTFNPKSVLPPLSIARAINPIDVKPKERVKDDCLKHPIQRYAANAPNSEKRNSNRAVPEVSSAPSLGFTPYRENKPAIEQRVEQSEASHQPDMRIQPTQDQTQNNEPLNIRSHQTDTSVVDHHWMNKVQTKPEDKTAYTYEKSNTNYARENLRDNKNELVKDNNQMQRMPESNSQLDESRMKTIESDKKIHQDKFFREQNFIPPNNGRFSEQPVNKEMPNYQQRIRYAGYSDEDLFSDEERRHRSIAQEVKPQFHKANIQNAMPRRYLQRH